MDFKAFFKTIRKTVVKRSPEILTGVGIGGMIATVVLAVKATPKALKQIEEKKERTSKEKLTVAETVKTTWKCYIPATVMFALSTACIVSASSQNLKRKAALTTACSLSERALGEYQAKVAELFGEKKDTEVKEAIAKDRIDKNPPQPGSVIITNKGNVRCYDSITGRYFDSDCDTLKRAMTEIKRMLLKDDYATLNDFYYEIGLEPTKDGNELVWTVMDELDKGVDVEFYAHLSPDGIPCIYVGYTVPPHYDYERY